LKEVLQYSIAHSIRHNNSIECVNVTSEYNKILKVCLVIYGLNKMFPITMKFIVNYYNVQEL